MKLHLFSLILRSSEAKIYIQVVHYRVHYTCLQALSGVLEHAVCLYSIFLNACNALSSLSLSAILPPLVPH